MATPTSRTERAWSKPSTWTRTCSRTGKSKLIWPPTIKEMEAGTVAVDLVIDVAVIGKKI